MPWGVSMKIFGVLAGAAGLLAVTMRARVIAMAVVMSFMVAGVGSAQASLLWDWSYSGGGHTGSGTLTTGDLSGGDYSITAVDGTWDASPITGIAPASSCCIAGFNDNLLLSGSPQLDSMGFAFDISGDVINIFYFAGFAYSVDDPNTTLAENGSFSATIITPSVPEPASFALLGTALLGFGAVWRRRERMS